MGEAKVTYFITIRGGISMKKKITIGVLFLLMAAPTIAFGQTIVNNNSNDFTDGTKVALVSDIVIGVGKGILYQVGSQVLQKYGAPNIFPVPSYVPPVQIPTAPMPAATTTVPAVNTTPASITVPPITTVTVTTPQEPLIPVTR